MEPHGSTGHHHCDVNWGDAMRAFLFAAVLAWAGPVSAGALVDVCEAVLKKRLALPSSYKRVRASVPSQTAATWTDYRGLDDPKRAAHQQALDQGDARERALAAELRAMFARMPDPRLWEVDFAFVAQASSGARIEQVALCSVVADASVDLSEISSRDVRINGDTHLEWVFRRAR